MASPTSYAEIACLSEHVYTGQEGLRFSFPGFHMMSLELARYRDRVWGSKMPNVLHHGTHCHPPSHPTCVALVLLLVLVLVLVSHGTGSSFEPKTIAITRIRSRDIPLHFLPNARRSTRLFYSPCKATDYGLGVCLGVIWF
jgi:hypothetical protein